MSTREEKVEAVREAAYPEADRRVLDHDWETSPITALQEKFVAGSTYGATKALSFTQEDVDAAAEALWKAHGLPERETPPHPLARAKFNEFRSLAIRVLESFGARFAS